MKASSVRVLLVIVPLAASARAQTIDDGLLMPSGVLGTGSFYAHESWSQYWEGTLKRDNGNIGTLTTQSVTWVAGYGVTDRLSVMALLPYVWTRASQGTLQGMHGVQDFTLAAKYRLLSTPFTERGTLHAMVVGAAGIPASNYVPDFLPLSIGLASRRFSGRFTLNFQAYAGWFVTGSAAYTWRTKVTLDRPAYYTNGQLYLSNQVAMPNVVDYTVTAGYEHGRLCIPISLSQQRTEGGGDIRRQVADDRLEQPHAIRGCGSGGGDVRRVCGRAGRDQDGTSEPHGRAAQLHRILGRRRRAALEPDRARAGGTVQSAAGAAPRRHVPGAGPRESIRRSSIPVRQPALRRAGVQLRGGGPVRGAQDGVVLEVPVPPPVARPDRWRHPGVDARGRLARLSLRGRGAVWRHRRNAEGALPGGRGRDHPASRGATQRRAVVR